MGARARTHDTHAFSIQRLLSDIEGLYADLLARPAGASQGPAVDPDADGLAESGA